MDASDPNEALLLAFADTDLSASRTPAEWGELIDLANGLLRAAGAK